jgi:hypothetical protein
MQEAAKKEEKIDRELSRTADTETWSQKYVPLLFAGGMFLFLVLVALLSKLD